MGHFLYNQTYLGRVYQMDMNHIGQFGSKSYF